MFRVPKDKDSLELGFLAGFLFKVCKGYLWFLGFFKIPLITPLGIIGQNGVQSCLL